MGWGGGSANAPVAPPLLTGLNTTQYAKRKKKKKKKKEKEKRKNNIRTFMKIFAVGHPSSS